MRIFKTFIFILVFVGICGAQTALAHDVRLDPTFNGVGYVTHNGAAGGSARDSANSLQIQSDGKYVAAGESTNIRGNTDMTIWRYNPDGTLDTTFNGVGYVSHDSAAGGGSSDAGYSLQIQSDGKYVVAGDSKRVEGDGDLVIWRYNSDGTLDTSFNGVGYVTHNSAAGGEYWDGGYSLQIQSDGKYVVAGYSSNATRSGDMAIWRYNPDGTLDESFNGVGYVTHDGAAGGTNWDRGQSLQIQSDGKYVVTGYSTNPAFEWDMAIWRYNSDGTIDTTFNGVGYVTHSGEFGGYVSGMSLQIQSDGKYVVTGSSENAAGNNDVTVWRFNTDGTIDTTFNGVGYVLHDNAAGGNGSDTGSSLSIQPDGKYVVAGSSRSASFNSDMAVWRFNTDGTLDTTFNDVGYVTHDNAAGGDGNDWAQSLQIQSDGKYVIGGGSIDPTWNFDMTIWRYEDFYRADLSLTKMVDNSSPDEGSTLTYAIRVTNDGPHEATNIVVDDVIPSGLTYVEGSMSGGDWQDDRDPYGAGLSASIASLSSGEFRDLTYQAQVDTATGGETITNNCRIVGADSSDDDPTDDESSVDITVQTAEVEEPEDEGEEEATEEEPSGLIDCVLTIDDNADGRPDALDVTISDYNQDGIPYCCQDSSSPAELLSYDSDGDGFSDCAEYAFGSDPFDASDINYRGGGFNCQFVGSAADSPYAALTIAILLVFMGMSRRCVKRVRVVKKRRNH